MEHSLTIIIDRMAKEDVRLNPYSNGTLSDTAFAGHKHYFFGS